MVCFTTDVGPVSLPTGSPLSDVVARLVASGARHFDGEGVEGRIHREPRGVRVTLRLKKKPMAEARLVTCSCGARVRPEDFFGRCRACLGGV